LLVAEPTNSLIAFSDAAAQLVERSASSIVAVHGGGRWPSSGIHWRSGVIVTAEEVLERDEDIKVALPGGRVVAASLAGRDPSTDVAVLRFQPDGLSAASIADAASLRPGHIVLAIGNHEGAPLASLGIVAIAGPAWRSLRGGAIDSLIRLDLALSPAAEGGAVVDVQGRQLINRARAAGALCEEARRKLAPILSAGWRVGPHQTATLRPCAPVQTRQSELTQAQDLSRPSVSEEPFLRLVAA
jgi:S1-C subfamily serine protease